MQPGTIITDIEGHDVGEQGAVVVSVDGDDVELAVLDTKEFITVDLADLDFHAEDAAKTEDPGPSNYDPEAMNSPELHTIRTLPTFWGPRDVNNPSSLTDVSYRPEPSWNRQQHRHYSTDDGATPGDIRMTYKRTPRRRTADSLYGMDPVPHRQPVDRHVQRDYGLPRRMRLDRWEGHKDDLLDTDALVAHTIDFWKQYRTKRYTFLSESGSHRSLDLRDWGLMYMHRAGLERSETELLYRFMAATELIPYNEYQEFQDLLDTYYVFRYDRVSG